MEKCNRAIKVLFATAIVLCSMYIVPASAALLPVPKIAWLDAYSEGVPTLDDFEILYVDGGWLQGRISDSAGLSTISEIKDALLSGKPTVMFGGDILLSDMIDNLRIKERADVPLLAHALKIYPDIGFNGGLASDQLFVAGHNATMDEVEAKVYDWAYRRVSNDHRSTLESFPAEPDNPELYGVSFGTTSASDPYWLLIGVSTLYVYINPVGNLVITRNWYQLINDGSNTYDWLNVIMETTSVPGRVAYGSDWNTADIWNSEDVNYYGDPNLLIDYGPSDTSGASTVTYETGVEEGVKGARITYKMSVSYSVQDVTVHEESDPNENLAKWWHDVPEGKATGQNTYTIKPGATIRIQPQSTTYTHSRYQVQYAHWVWIIPGIWGYWDFWKSEEFKLETELYHPRTINLFVLKASNSPSWWVNNIESVKNGVLQARADALDAEVKLADEQINVYELTSTQDLLGLVANPPLRAVFVNTHGEVLPMPNEFFGPSVHITSPSDGSTRYSSTFTLYANVYPPPGTSIQLGYNPNTGQHSYVWYEWVRASTGATSDWRPMNPQSSAGGTYSASVSLPGYDTYYIYVGAYANNIWTNAYITVKYKYSGNGGGGGCPYVSTWNGLQFVLDNSLLSGSKYSNGQDVMDYYKLEQKLVANADGTYSLLLSEFQQEHSFMDYVELLAVDHLPDVNVAISPQGEILTYTDPSPPTSAKDDNKKQVKNLIESIDGNYYEGYNGSYITLNFGEDIDISHGAKLVLRADAYYIKVSIRVQVQDADKKWTDVATVIPRPYWATEIIDMSEHLPDANGDMKVRLYFTANHKLDFVGLDTSPQAALNIKQGQLLSAKHGAAGVQVLGTGATGTGATYENLLCKDDFHAELTPGYQIDMNFRLPTKETIEEVRDYIFVVKGRYKEAGDPPRAVAAMWQDWFNLLEDNTKEYGWIWANVAGYSFYYFGNTWYSSKFPGYTLENDQQQPRAEGLKTFLSESDAVCHYYDGHWAERKYGFNREGFVATYNIPSSVSAIRPFAVDDLLWNTVGYIDDVTGDIVTASIAMNTTYGIGNFIHSGLSPDADGSGAEDYQDDELKGYISTALAIEEARSYLMPALFKSRVYSDEEHGASFLISTVVGGWGSGPEVGVRYMDLILAISGHYPRNIDQYWTEGILVEYTIFLSSGDFNGTALSDDVTFEVNVASCGLETGGESRELMDKLLWWCIGFAVTTLGMCLEIPYLGTAFGLIPILVAEVTPDPEVTPVLTGPEVYMPGPSVDPDEDDWGTLSCYIRVKFHGQDGEGTRSYSFKNGITSWVGWQSRVPPFENPPVNRGVLLSIEREFEFTVDW